MIIDETEANDRRFMITSLGFLLCIIIAVILLVQILEQKKEEESKSKLEELNVENNSSIPVESAIRGVVFQKDFNASFWYNDREGRTNLNTFCYKIPSPPKCDYILLKNGTKIPAGSCYQTYNYIVKCIDKSEIVGVIIE